MAQSLKSTAPLFSALGLLSNIFVITVGLGAPNLVHAEEMIFHDLRIMGADLIDEMAYQWIKNSPVTRGKSVVIADISAPIGIDSRFNQFVENRLFEIIESNPQLPLTFVHCSQCMQLTAVSGPKRTVISRGIDQPEVLQSLIKLSPDNLGLSLHFEAEGRELVLRAELFELIPPQKIVWAKRLSTTMDQSELLRNAPSLVSLDTAREEKQKLLQGREPLSTMTRFNIRNFQAAIGQIPPLVFISQSLETSLLPNRNRKFIFEIGFTSIKDLVQGWTIGGEYASLIGRNMPSLVNPDVYWFAGVEYMSLEGPGAAPFGQGQFNLQALLNSNEDPKAGMTFLKFGFEALVKNRFGLATYLEYAPILADSQILVTQNALGIPYQTVGVSVEFQW